MARGFGVEGAMARRFGVEVFARPRDGWVGFGAGLARETRTDRATLALRAGNPFTDFFATGFLAAIFVPAVFVPVVFAAALFPPVVFAAILFPPRLFGATG
jgi:hypothetical protein